MSINYNRTFTPQQNFINGTSNGTSNATSSGNNIGASRNTVQRSAWEEGPPFLLNHAQRFTSGRHHQQQYHPEKNFNRPPLERRSQYYSAGILPYARDNGGNLVFLLGKDKDGNWSDFGGRSEITDGGVFTRTAARELYEETMGAVLTLDSAYRMLTLPTYNEKRKLIYSKTLGGSPYYMYGLEILYADYKKNFKRVFEYVRYIGHKFIEKVDIKWVSAETLISAIDKDLRNEEVLVPLRPIFKTTLENHLEEIKSLL
tara:strand:- start:601 stop:1374 length:774 start_codon:yes stop_codon:yes gene_type:complete